MASALARPGPPPRQDLPALAIELKGLEKVYAAQHGQAAKRALDGIDLEVPRGSFFGLLGPNGAGKSTLINILAGLVVKTAGTARILGIDIDAHPRRARLAIGVVPQELNLDAFFSPRETLEFQAGLFGVPRRERRTAELLHAVGLADKARRLCALALGRHAAAAAGRQGAGPQPAGGGPGRAHRRRRRRAQALALGLHARAQPRRASPSS